MARNYYWQVFLRLFIEIFIALLSVNITKPKHLACIIEESNLRHTPQATLQVSFNGLHFQ